jgi:N-acetylglucosamine kinase-like BadF-type ATPase
MKSKDIIIGLDGGATTTKCIITDIEGHVLDRAISGPSNIQEGNEEERKRQLKNAINNSLKVVLNLSFKEQFCVRSICLGVAGLSDGSKYHLIKKIVNKLLNPEKIKIIGDKEITVKGASLDQPSIIIYAGTGSFCYGKDENGNIANVGGWGYIIDDKGAGYDIGRMALRALFRAYDGREKKTQLTSKILKYFSCKSPIELSQKIYSYNLVTKCKISKLSVLVTEAAICGDNVAKQILNQASKELAKCVFALTKKLFFRNKLCIYPCGGVFNDIKFILKPFEKEISKKIKHYSIITPFFTPDIGALIIAAEEIGIKINNKFVQNIKKTYDNKQ